MELVTQISMRSKRASTVTAKVATAAESVTSRALQNTSCPVDFSNLAAASSTVAAMPADGDVSAFACVFLRDGPSQFLDAHSGSPPAMKNAQSDGRLRCVGSPANRLAGPGTAGREPEAAR